MQPCAICKTEIRGLICNSCFQAWPKGKSFSEYCNVPLSPEPKVIRRGVCGAPYPPP